MKETVVNVNKTKSWFFEKINKIDKPLARLINNNKRPNQQNRNGKGEVTTDNEEIQNKGPSGQSYGFPSGHAWMWGLNCKESSALKN